MISPLEDLYQSRTNRDRAGTIPDEWNLLLLQRDLDRLISEGLVARVTNIREIPAHSRDQTWYQEIGTGNLYVYVAAGERRAPQFRRHSQAAPPGESHLVQ